jgi:polyisoprenoid-binding protein YceI
MKSRIGSIAVGLLLLAAPAIARAAEWEIDRAHSSVGFTIRHLGISKVNGTFNDFTGTLSFDEKSLEGGSVVVTVQVASIDTRVEKRDNHLRSAEFFDVEQYPVISFKSTSVEKTENGFLLNGRLTIRNVEKEVSIPFEFLGTIQDERMGTRAGFEGTFKLTREEYNVGWHAPWQPPLLGNDVDVTLNLEVVQKQE